LLAFYPAKGLDFAINLRVNPSERRKMKEIELNALDRAILGALTHDRLSADTPSRGVAANVRYGS
jgi:hypothetical protein